VVFTSTSSPDRTIFDVTFGAANTSPHFEVVGQSLAGIRHVENMYGIIDKMLSDDPEYYGVMEQRIFSSHY
jgi:hypothetical protein